MKLIAFDSYELPKILDIEDQFSTIQVVVTMDYSQRIFTEDIGLMSPKKSWVTKDLNVISMEICVAKKTHNDLKTARMISVMDHYKSNPQFKKEMNKAIKSDSLNQMPELK